jgi:hypothetical protein
MLHALQLTKFCKSKYVESLTIWGVKINKKASKALTVEIYRIYSTPKAVVWPDAD